MISSRTEAGVCGYIEYLGVQAGWDCNLSLAALGMDMSKWNNVSCVTELNRIE